VRAIRSTNIYGTLRLTPSNLLGVAETCSSPSHLAKCGHSRSNGTYKHTHLVHLSYHVELGRGRSNRIAPQGSPKIMGTLGPHSLRMESRHCPICVTMPNLVTLGQTVGA